MHTSTHFRLPDPDDGSGDVVIIQWHVAPGDYITAGQPLLTVASATAQHDIAAPGNALVGSIEAAEGVCLAPGALLAILAAPPDARSDGSIAADSLSNTHAGSTAALRASAATRRLARSLRHELESIAGDDADEAPAAARTEAPDKIHAPVSEACRESDDTRRAMAAQMRRACETPSCTLHTQARIIAWHGHAPPLLRLIRALVHACRSEPALYCRFAPSRPARLLHETVDIALLCAAPDGQYSTLLRDAAAHDDATVLTILAEARETASHHGVQAELQERANISLVDLSAIGCEAVQLPVPAPQLALVSAGSIHEAVLARAGMPVVEPVLSLSLSFDPRRVTPIEAARFLAALREHLEHAALH